MSLYAQYLTERTDDEIIETEYGFCTYRYLNDDKSVYIVDIFVIPEQRKSGVASQLADEVVKEGKLNGAVELLGTVIPSTKNSTTSMRVLLGYGMRLHSAAQDLIIFRKDI